jgi:hypothetical protein
MSMPRQHKRDILKAAVVLIMAEKPQFLMQCMYLLLEVWEDELNYVTSECVQQCWRKANILPTSVDINNAIGLLGLCPQERQEDFIH